jgi:hypothetical protein
MLIDIQKPGIYIAPDIQLNNQNQVSVRLLLRRAGRNSGPRRKKYFKT